MVILAFAMAAPALSVTRPLIPPLVAISCAKPDPDEHRRMTTEASRDIALVPKGLTRFMINPPDIEKSLSVNRAAQVLFISERPCRGPYLLNRLVNESRKKVCPGKGGSKNSNQLRCKLRLNSLLYW